MQHSRFIGLGVCALACVTASQQTYAATLPAGFSETSLTGVISAGTTFEFGPTGLLYVLEQAGTMEVYQGSGAGPWTQIAPNNNFFDNNPLVLSSFFERGLLGIAFDPDYANNRYVYVYYTSTSGGVHNRISRFTASANGSRAVANSEMVMVDLDGLSAGNHNGGAMHFGPHDGMLYVATGENAVSSNSQNINNRLGKILRYDFSLAAPYIPASNPNSFPGIAGTTSGANEAIWAVGLRNPYTFSFQMPLDPSRGATPLMYINDVGQNAYEEINVGQQGVNYGWPSTEGPFNQASFPNFTHPLVWYHHSNFNLSRFQVSGFTGFAITGGAFYNPEVETFPASYWGDYFFADYISDWIKVYDPVSDSLQNFATSAFGCVDLRVGPDGMLYYLARDAAGSGAGRVYRVTPTTPAPETGACCLPDGTSCQIRSLNQCNSLAGTWAGAGTICPDDCAPPCPTDLTGAGGNPDGVTDVNDLFLLLANWNTSGPGADLAAPTNIVDVADLFVMLSAFGDC